MFDTGGGLKLAGGRTKLVMLVGGVLLALFAMLAGYFFWQYNQAKTEDAQNQATAKRISIKVSNLYLTPQETPTVAEIKDKEKLKDQAFFNDAQSGDFLLVYTQAKTALIYREAVNKLVNVGPISQDQAAPVPGQDSEAPN